MKSPAAYKLPGIILLKNSIQNLMRHFFFTHKRQFFRTFSGHTQVNATDLRTLRFPTAATLGELGRNSVVSQLEVDSLVKELIAA